MRKLILLLALFSISAQADQFTVTRNGKTSTFDSEEYVVVKRRKGPKPAPKAEVKPAPCPEPKVVVQPAPVRKNTVKLYGGVGPSTYKTRVEGSTMHISQDYDPLFGVGYSRKVSERWSVEAIGLSNYTGILGVGYDF